MMRVKKVTAVFLTVLMTMGMITGCTTGKSDQSASGNASTTNAGKTNSKGTKTDTGEAKNTATAGNGKAIVVYYSATGNTKAVAKKIAKLTESDIFEIEPKKPYTDDDLDWTNDDSRVSKEHEDESLRNVELVSTKVDHWDSYDTVYIGYPIWWGIAAWPVDNFVKANDFTGKTVIPFCTAASSGIGDSGELLKEMAGSGDWKDGERFYEGASQKDISEWINTL